MAAAPLCKTCGGTGEVIFTKEHGGPVCNTCHGQGYIDSKVLRPRIAAILDFPSVYMGGPSHGNLRKADRILEMLKELRVIDV